MKIKLPSAPKPVETAQETDAKTTAKANPFANVFAKSAAKPTAKKSDPMRLLHGTGLTKKLGIQAEKSSEQILAQAEKLAATSDAIIPQPDVLDLSAKSIVDNMMPDGIQLDEYQQAALEGGKYQKYFCLIGAAGTGKTTTVKALISAIESTTPLIDINLTRTESNRTDHEQLNVAICFCSFTGRAVQQMKRAIPKSYHPMCQTIHATLGYMPMQEEYQDKETGEWKEKRVFRPTFTATNKLPYKICIVDEAGMVPIYLWNELLAALPEDARVILIGDINQLPPVQGRSVLGFAMTKWPTYTLEKIHRQAEGNPIIENAHRILQGKLPIEDRARFRIIDATDGSLSALNKLVNTLMALKEIKKFDPINDACIVPQNKGTIGQLHINEKLVTKFNPMQKTEEGIPLNPRHVITAGYHHVMFAIGDKVMLLQNDNQRGLTNGMTGVVHEIVVNAKYKGELAAQDATMRFDDEIDFSNLDEEIAKIGVDTEEDDKERQASHIMRVKFQNVKDLVDFQTSGDFGKVTHAYAFTCHKSQGGEYPTVVILAHSANLKMLSREWLYTAVTRAQERVILLCNRRGLIHAVNNQKIKGKTVAEKAAAFLALQDKSDTQVPNLPEPQIVELKPYKQEN